jgi:hypothetical protein
LFRALHIFSGKQFSEGTGAALLADRVLPMLPVYEILQSLRLYHDTELAPLRMIEHAFPPGNSALSALREDIDAMESYLGSLRRELVRRHGLNVTSFFDGDQFQEKLLPAVRPDLAVLLQPDLFNTDSDELFRTIEGPLDPAWAQQVRQLLTIPKLIRGWRDRAWKLLREPVFGRVQSFVELAHALATLSSSGTRQPFLPGGATPSGRLNLQSARGRQGEDAMEQFLGAAFEYLTTISSEQLEVPTTVVRALQEVERIMKIEEQALRPREQEELRFCLLQIARLAGENG